MEISYPERSVMAKGVPSSRVVGAFQLSEISAAAVESEENEESVNNNDVSNNGSRIGNLGEFRRIGGYHSFPRLSR